MTTRILLVDDHEIVRDGLRALIRAERSMTVVGEAADGQAAVRIARKVAPDIVLMDIGMPGMNGLDATKQLLALKKKPKVICLSMHSDKRYVLQMLKAGASGYLLKDSAFEELLTAIFAVRKGKVYLTSEAAAAVVMDFRRAAKERDGSAFAVLTDREREVLQLIAEGSSTKETASTLGVSIKTVETHRRQIMERLGLRSVAELTKYAVKEGLTAL